MSGHTVEGTDAVVAYDHLSLVYRDADPPLSRREKRQVLRVLRLLGQRIEQAQEVPDA